MPHYQCMACRVRVLEHSADPAAESCPECGLPMSTVSDLTEVVGFRRLASVRRYSVDSPAAAAAALAIPGPPA